MNSLLEKQRRGKRLWLIAFIIVLGAFIAMGYAYYDTRRSTNSQEERQEQKTEMLRERLDSALAQKKAAEQELEKVRRELAQAREAVMEADSARARLLRLKRQAEIAKRNAELEALRRVMHVKTLEQAVEKAQSSPPPNHEEEQVAEKNNPEPAENESKSWQEQDKSMYQTLARLLGYKAQRNYEDQQLNYLMARQAHQFNKKYGNFERDAVVFEGLRHAWKLTGVNNAHTLDAKTLLLL